MNDLLKKRREILRQVNQMTLTGRVDAEDLARRMLELRRESNAQFQYSYTTVEDGEVAVLRTPMKLSTVPGLDTKHYGSVGGPTTPMAVPW